MPELPAIKKNDEVYILRGKDRGKTGRVLIVIPKDQKVVVEGVQMIKRHTRPNPQRNIKGGIVEKEGAMSISADGRRQPLLGIYRVSALQREVQNAAAQGGLADAAVFRLLARLDLLAVPVPAGSTDDVDTWAALGTLYQQVNQFDLELRSCQEAVRLDARSADAWGCVGGAQIIGPATLLPSRECCGDPFR